MKFLSKIDLRKYKNSTALVRVDLNIENCEKSDNKKKIFITHPRIKAILPTIKLLLKNDLKVVILSHKGRPTKNHSNKQQAIKRDRKILSLKPFAGVLQKELKQEVVFVPKANKANEANKANKANLFILENLRFWSGEERNDAVFARRLAKMGDFYVNDAFAVSHRKNASVVAITKYLPSYAGLLLEKEIVNLSRALEKPKKPITIIIGGAKISDKIGIIDAFWKKADYFLVGGGPANAFFAAQGLPIGDSLVDKKINLKRFVRGLNVENKIILPIDLKIDKNKILSIGEKTILKYREIILNSKTIIWNGPLGFYEKKGFEKGTAETWRAVLENKKACVIVGGGETHASLKLLKANEANKLMKLKANLFLSTGGGAMLEYLSGKKMPGITALQNK